jgi:electron transfer flavoprotein beta subunit
MKIIVCSKQIRQDNRIKPDRSGLEAALRLKKKTGAAVAFLCLGDASAITQIREAMAMGCDEGTLLSYPEPQTLDGAACSSILAAFLRNCSYDALISSSYAVDSDAIQTGLLLAGKLSLPSASYVEDITPVFQEGQEHIQEDQAGSPEGAKPVSLVVRRKFEDCVYKLKLPLPCLVSALPRPNQPFYMTAQGISRAYRSEIPVVSVSELLERSGLPPAEQFIKIHIHDSHMKKPRERGRVLTVPTAEAVQAMMDLMIKNHILS